MTKAIPPFNAYDGPTSEERYAAAAQQKPAGTVYTREQKGHSLILHLTLGAVVLWIPAIYYSISPRHFWHA